MNGEIRLACDRDSHWIASGAAPPGSKLTFALGAAQ